MGLGPSTKETTLHHYRDPLTEALVLDNEVDFPGVVLLGTSDDYARKMLIAQRTGAWIEAMRVDGALVSLDSWGNCHIDFTSVIEALGERRIPLVGLSFVGNQAAFVVTNSYMGTIIDLNKTSAGVESLVVGQNTADELDAKKALSILKMKIRKKNPERHFAFDAQSLVSSAPSSVGSGNAEREVRRIMRRIFPVREVRLGERTTYANQSLDICTASVPRIVSNYAEIQDMSVKVIAPRQHDVPVNSILDFSPIVTKVAGRPGEGISHAFSGLCVLLTAVEESGFQPANCGAAAGVLGEKVIFGRRGTPDLEDYIIQVDVRLAPGQGRTREGICAAHQACDELVQEIRTVLRGLESSLASVKEELWDKERRGAMRIVLIKLVAGLGCLYDTVLLPPEPCGCLGGTSIMDLGNMNLLLSPNEYRDGMVHSMY